MRIVLLCWVFFWMLGGAQERPVQWLQRAQQAESSLVIAGVRITEIQAGRSVRRIEERFWRQGARSERIEILAPPERRGEILIFREGRWLVYRPSDKEALELSRMPLPGNLLLQTAIELIQAGIVQSEPPVETTLNGRTCVLLRLSLARPKPPRGVSPERREPFPASVSLWIDKETGVILRREVTMHPNAPALRTEITRLEINPRITPDMFNLPPGVVARPLEGTYKTVEEAQRVVPFPIRTPAYLPEKATLERVLVRWRGPGRAPVVILHYQTPSARFSLFQAYKTRDSAFQRPSKRPERLNVRFWQDDDYVFGLVGDLPRAEIEKIARSLSR
ncbi:MAG: hypothetical protein N2651_10685 [Fimbriimonadales bacterium]|nr:hypothetical protein [Fimbriimonadales bacterium]